MIVIQETHSTPDCYEIWRNEWGSQIIMSHGESNSRGVMILIKRQCNITLENLIVDPQGRYFVSDIKEKDSIITCIFLYAPNKDDPSFFMEFAGILRERSELRMLIGDFNTVLNVEKDRLNTYHNNNKAKEEIQNLMEEFSLRDVWRDQNPDTLQYSWVKNQGTQGRKASRIDYALVSAGLDQKIPNCMYKSGVMSDHRAFFVVLDIDYVDRGVGYWKFNTSLLRDREFLKEMNNEIDISMEALAAKGPIERWEKLKVRIKKKTQKYTRNKSSEQKQIICSLSEAINQLEDNLPLNEKDSKILDESKIELEEKLAERIAGVMFRSKARWYEQGEKSSKYFYALEKANYNAKTCYCTFNQDGHLVKNPHDILGIQKEFYMELYSRDENVEFTLTNNSNIWVPEEIRTKQDQDLTLSEISLAVKQMQNGEDGIPVDFYKVFWSKLATPFMEMLEEVHEQKKLHTSARIGILNLIPKANKDARLVKNLRPITLLNVDYKIIEKAIANKMIPALETLIHKDQRGFMKNRRISVNIRKLLDIMEYVKENDIDAVVLSLDFVKCFDKCSFSILHGSLEFFQFGNVVKEWTKILYDDFKVKIQNNGYFSDYIDIKKGVHQGGCCSSIYFLVIAEILAMALRDNGDIQGITIQQVTNLLNQFADDTDVFSLGEEKSIRAIFEELENFRTQSGFTISYDKTVLYRIGSLRHSRAQMYNIDQVAWSNEDITVLGVCVSHQNMLEKNYAKILYKVKQVMANWENRNLTLTGKVLVVNTLVASLFVYHMMVMLTIPTTMLKNVENEIRAYIWGG